jgi:hypothetical protein
MPPPEHFDVLVLGSGTGGKLIKASSSASGDSNVPRRPLQHVTPERAA